MKRRRKKTPWWKRARDWVVDLVEAAVSYQ